MIALRVPPSLVICPPSLVESSGMKKLIFLMIELNKCSYHYWFILPLGASFVNMWIQGQWQVEQIDLRSGIWVPCLPYDIHFIPSLAHSSLSPWTTEKLPLYFLRHPDPGIELQLYVSICFFFFTKHTVLFCEPRFLPSFLSSFHPFSLFTSQSFHSFLQQTLLNTTMCSVLC